MRTLILLLISFTAFGQLPDTPPLGIKSDGVGEDRSIALAVDGDETGDKSLLDLCATAEVSPCSILDFLGWPPIVAPTAPTEVELDWSKTSCNYVVISWSGATGDITEYRIEVSVNEGSWSSLNTGPYEYYEYEELEDNLDYQFRVRAEGPGGNSSYTDSDVLSTRPPAIPTGATASKNSISGIDLIWESGVTGGTVQWYELFRRENSGSWQLYEPDLTPVLGQNYYYDTDVTTGVTYEYAIVPHNCYGENDEAISNPVLYIP